MKKSLSIITILAFIIITGCQSTTTPVKNSASEESKQLEKASSASKVTIKVTGDEPAEPKAPPSANFKSTTVDLGDGLKVEGMVDSSIKLESKPTSIMQPTSTK